MAVQQPVEMTGRGIVSPLGAGVERNFQRMCHGDLATGPAPGLWSLRPGQHVGTVDQAELTVLASQRGLRRLDRTVVLAVQAVTEALHEANLLPTEDRRIPGHRIALCLGTSTGPANASTEAAFAFASGGEALLKRTQPLSAVHAAQAGIAGEIARRFQIEGPSMTLNAECASGNTVVGIGQQLLASGAADAVICCSVDSSVVDLYVAQANLIGALASGPCRPFDLDRDGFVLSEGAAAVVLETAPDDPAAPSTEHRAAPQQIRMLGVGMSTDTSHATAPSEDGHSLARAVLSALEQAKLTPQDIDVVSVHGTGTPRNDITELRALEHVLGEGLSQTPVHSLKSMIGHTLAAAGLIELVILSRTLEAGVIPPTVGCRSPLPTRADLVLDTARAVRMTVGLSTSCGFGGNNTAAVLSIHRSRATTPTEAAA